MDVKEAIALAKRHVREMFADENIADVGLEEVEFDDASNEWLVTVGFSRPWDRPPVNPFVHIAEPLKRPGRSFKIVRIADANGAVRAVQHREIPS